MQNMEQHSTIWHNSLTRRVCLWLLAGLRGSKLAGFWPFMARQYQASRLRGVWEHALGRPLSATERAGAFGLTGRLWAVLRRWTAALRPEDSLLARLIRAIRGSGLLRHSVTGRFLLRLRPGDVLLGAFCLFLPLDWGLRTYAPAAVGTLWCHAFLVLCILIAVLRTLNPNRAFHSDATPLDGPMLLFIGIGVLLVGVVSPSLSVAVEGWRAVYEYMFWFYVIVRLARGRRAVWLCYTLFVLMGVLVGLHGVYQYIVGTPIPAGWVSVYETGVRTRAFSIVGSPNILGCLMVMLAPMAAGLAYTMRGNGRKLLCWAGVGVMCLCCVFTFSRGAWVGLAVAVVLFALLRDRRLLLLAALAALAGLLTPQIANRISFLFTADFARNNSTAGRGARWEYGLGLLGRSDALFGFGLGRFGGAVAMRNQTLENVTYFYLDNYYMKTFVEMGWLGLGGYLLLLAATLWNGLRALFRVRKHNESYSLACGLFSGMAGVLVHCYFENIFEVPYMNAYFWGLAALLFVIGWRMNAGHGGEEKSGQLSIAGESTPQT